METKSFSTSLQRDLGLIPAVMLVIGNTIGTGIFTTSGFILKEVGDPGALLLVWLLGGIISLFGALSYAELGKMFPRAGGEYTFLKESLGEAFGFIAGWISLIVGFSAPIAATAIAFSKYLLELFHFKDFGLNLKINQIPLLTLSYSTILSILAILILSFIHLQRVKIGANFQTGITIFKILFILVFLTLGFLGAKDSFTQFELADLIPQRESVFSLGFPVSFIYVMYAYSGWNAATYVGEEIKNPEKNIPLSLLFGTLTVIGFYMGLNLLYLRVLSVNEMSGVLEIGAKTAEKLFGEGISFLFTLGITLGLLSVLSAMILAGPRVYYAMARDKVFFKIFSQVDPKTKTPVFSILLQAIIAIFMVLTSSFEALLLYIGFTLSLCASLTAFGLIKLKRKLVLSAGLFILANLWIVFFSIITKPLTLLAGFLTILVGIFLYRFRFKNNF
ncbi:MAG: amino acid permease [Thermodesulfobacteriaceae bacterium]|nr:amino acid permease [Thermodesulfobacteriaceae bacterium]MCX8042328.1 amino acid permease [Thermodesulfobacteriaceae bacterium]